jgi:hypothetical protein
MSGLPKCSINEVPCPPKKQRPSANSPLIMQDRPLAVMLRALTGPTQICHVVECLNTLERRVLQERSGTNFLFNVIISWGSALLLYELNISYYPRASRWPSEHAQGSMVQQPIVSQLCILRRSRSRRVIHSNAIQARKSPPAILFFQL